MATLTTPLEIKMYAALRKISREYMSAQRLLKSSDVDWGVSGQEALEMAYENIQEEAKRAIKGVRLPK